MKLYKEERALADGTIESRYVNENGTPISFPDELFKRFCAAKYNFPKHPPAGPIWVEIADEIIANYNP